MGHGYNAYYQIRTVAVVFNCEKQTVLCRCWGTELVVFGNALNGYWRIVVNIEHYTTTRLGRSGSYLVKFPIPFFSNY